MASKFTVFDSALSLLCPVTPGIPESVALACLGILVEYSKNKVIECASRGGDDHIEFDLLHRQLLLCVRETEFFTNPHFATCLRLAILNIHKELKDDPDWKQKWPQLFGARLAEIFPTDLGKRIAKHAIHKFFEDARLGVDYIVPSEETLANLYASRRCIDALNAGSSPATKPLKSFHSGTRTWREKCPNCGLEKRLDHNTKRFRCKQCGFDQPYPPKAYSR